MDGIDPLVGVTIIAATNRPDIIVIEKLPLLILTWHILLQDEALMRPGRFDRHIYVKLPDFPARLQIFEMQSKAMPFSDDIGMEILAEKVVYF